MQHVREVVAQRRLVVEVALAGALSERRRQQLLRAREVAGCGVIAGEVVEGGDVDPRVRQHRGELEASLEILAPAAQQPEDVVGLRGRGPGSRRLRELERLEAERARLVQLTAAPGDAASVAANRGLVRAVPFDFPSPMTGAPLHGSLRRLPDGMLNGHRVLGVAFVARGPLNGSLPDRPGTGLSGTITMNGTAYYAYADAMLMALDATLQIEGRVANSSQSDPVTIVYKRTIRPQTP